MSRAWKRQGGQSLTEFLVAMFGFGFLLLGLLQAILFYRAKVLVDYAAQEAARAGATSGVDHTKMVHGFARGLAPLYATGTPGVAGAAVALGSAELALTTGAGSIKVISPTRAAYTDFAEDQFDGKKALPNDSLYFRPDTVGKSSGLNVQDANLLKIQVTYRYRLIVPIIDKLIGTQDISGSVLAGHTVYYLPIVGEAMVRMQSPIYNSGNLP